MGRYSRRVVGGNSVLMKLAPVGAIVVRVSAFHSVRRKSWPTRRFSASPEACARPPSIGWRCARPRSCCRLGADARDRSSSPIFPLYNQDNEKSARRRPVAEHEGAIRAADAVLIVTPEYNYSIPGVLKNAIDWASRPYGDSAWDDKPVAIMGASVGLSARRVRSTICASGRVPGHARLNHPEVVRGVRREEARCGRRADRRGDAQGDRQTTRQPLRFGSAAWRRLIVVGRRAPRKIDWARVRTIATWKICSASAF